MNKAIKIQRAGNTTTNREEEISTYPIEYTNVALFNPTSGFASFLIPAVLMLILQQTLVLGIGLSAGTAVETNRFRDLVPINRHYHGTLRIVFGKTLAYFMPEMNFGHTDKMKFNRQIVNVLLQRYRIEIYPIGNTKSRASEDTIFIRKSDDIIEMNRQRTTEKPVDKQI